MPRKTQKRALFGSGSAIAVAMLAAPQASGQSLDNDYWITVQAYYPKVDTNVRVTADIAETIGTDIDLERDLSLDDRDILPAVTVGSRFGKIVVGFDFYKLNRDGVVELGRDINFDDVTFPLNARVQSGFDSDVYRLTVGYSFIQRPDLEIRAALGLHATNFTMSISGEVAGNEFEAESEARRRSILAPLPTVGLYGTWRIGRNFEANGRRLSVAQHRRLRRRADQRAGGDQLCHYSQYRDRRGLSLCPVPDRGRKGTLERPHDIRTERPGPDRAGEFLARRCAQPTRLRRQYADACQSYA